MKLAFFNGICYYEANPMTEEGFFYANPNQRGQHL